MTHPTGRPVRGGHQPPEDYLMNTPENTPTPDTNDDTPMTIEEARAHFEALGVEIVDDITIH